jgi:hypothetical protein
MANPTGPDRVIFIIETSPNDGTCEQASCTQKYHPKRSKVPHDDNVMHCEKECTQNNCRPNAKEVFKF